MQIERKREGRGPAMAFAAAAGALVLVGAVALSLQQARSEVCAPFVTNQERLCLVASPLHSMCLTRRLVLSLQLFGVDAIGPMSGAEASGYGPAEFTPDRAMRAEMKERENTRDQTHGHAAVSGAMAMLGPDAAAKLHSPGFAEALKEMRAAPTDSPRGRSAGSRTEALAQAAQPVATQGAKNEGGGSAQRFGWHPGRSTYARGSGEGLIQSGATQQALKEMRAHEVRFHSETPPSAKEKFKAARALSAGPEQRLLETGLWNDAGFGEKGPSATEHTMSFSGLRGHKLARVSEEGEHPEGAHGRSWNRALGKDATRLQQIRTAIDLKETDMHSLSNEERARAMEMQDLQKHALGLERQEMAAYGKAEMQRNNALRLAHKLLLEKKKLRAMARKIKFEEKRVHNNVEAGHKLKQQGKDEEKAFEDMTGPIKKAEEDVHIANQAYTKSELALAQSETTAERLATHPKLAQEAMARIKKLRKQSSAMSHLVQTASARLHTLQNANGPSSFTDGIDSHFSSPKKRAIQRMQKARIIEEEVDGLKAKEAREEHSIKARLPALHKQINSAKVLHNKYLHLHNAAETAQRKADKAKVQDLKLRRAVHFDATVLQHVKSELKADRGRYAKMTHTHH